MHYGNALRNRIQSGNAVIGPFMKTVDPAVVETAGLAGFDFAILDCEHGSTSYQTLGSLILAAEAAGMAAIVRIPHLSEEAVGKPLDLGAAGVQLPNVSHPEQVRQFVRFARFAPEGSRGVCRFVRAAKYSGLDKDKYFKQANEAILVIQVEGREGIANLDGILREDGYDVLFVGPYDLSQSLGKLGQIDAPEVIDAVETLLKKANDLGKHVGIFADTLESARRWKELGVRYLSYSVDMGLFYEKCSQIVQALR